MKLIILIWLLAISAIGAEVHLAWNASELVLPGVGPDPGVTNYTLYAHTNVIGPSNFKSAVVRQSVGTNLNVKIQGITGAWWFTVTAWKDGLESDPSNVIVGTWAIPKKAEAPLNMRFSEPFLGPQLKRYIWRYFTVTW